MAHRNADGLSPKQDSRQYRTYSPAIDMMMREVLQTLGDIDFQHQVELEKLETTTTDQELKRHIVEKIKAAHRKRREPYVDILTTLRKKQHRLAFAA